MFLVITSNLFNFHAFLPDSRSKGCTCIVPASGAQRQLRVAACCRVLPAQAPGTTNVTPPWCLILRCHWHPRNLLPCELHRFTNLFYHITGVWKLDFATHPPTSLPSRVWKTVPVNRLWSYFALLQLHQSAAARIMPIQFHYLFP